MLAIAGCGSDTDHGGDCSAFTGFATPLVPVDMISRVIPMGELNPPEDVVPATAGGFGFTVPKVDIVAPGDVVVTVVESTKYLVSPGRQGVTDFGLVMYACDDIKFRIDHIVELDASLTEKLGSGRCETYAGADETVEDCNYSVTIHLSAGDPIGTTGTYQNGVGVGLDFSAQDNSYEIPWANPDRIGDVESYKHGICVYSNFVPEIANAYLDHATQGLTPLDREDRCGTPIVDVAGTAQGVWVREDNPVTLQEDLLQDAPNFLTLSPGISNPDTLQHISPGVAALETELVTSDKQSTGRVNLDFTLIPDDGTIHCYEGVTMPGDSRAHFVALGADGVLTVQSTTFPCSESAPETWAFGPTAVRFIR